MALLTSKKSLPVFRAQYTTGTSEIKITSIFWAWRERKFVARGYNRWTPEGSAKGHWSKRASTHIDLSRLQVGTPWEFSHYE